MCAYAKRDTCSKILVESTLYFQLQKVDAPFTLQIAALRHSFSVLRRFAMPHAPYSGVSSLFDLHRRAPKPGGFFLRSVALV
jgi:hypothetical protein